MTINYGKRNPGSLTAASPGDTLYIPLQFYNDSGASISVGSTLVVTDIEVFKNGGIVERATDSGYAILGDTGNFDNRIGFKGISIQLFNTADDTGFYDAGSSYWVAIDNVTVDNRTVRFFPAVFEIGTPRANVVEINSDTGAGDQLQKAFANGLNDTGVNDRLAKILADTDTGIQSSVTVTALSDTGVNERLAAIEAHTDTGIQVGINIVQLGGDTGAASQLAQAFATTPTYFQQVDVQQVDGDTGAADILGKFAGDKLSAAGALDTGSLAGTQAGTVDANITYVNEVAVGGSGTSSDPWNPA